MTMRSMSDFRKKNLATLAKLGFVVSKSLPTKREKKSAVRPAREIAARFIALRELFMWVASQNPRKRANVNAALTPSERKIYALSRPKARAHQDTIGWRLENMWPLAWIMGFDEAPPPSGEMIQTKTIRRLMLEFEPAKKIARSEDDVLALEDLFYCAHNAGRSAQLGGKTVPKGFDPIAGTGVIHERRHALTWATSPRTAWDKTDLST